MSRKNTKSFEFGGGRVSGRTLYTQELASRLVQKSVSQGKNMLIATKEKHLYERLTKLFPKVSFKWVEGKGIEVNMKRDGVL